MLLTDLTLTQFRNYTKTKFSFSPTTIIIGNNAQGKTNILEAIYFLSFGKSFRAEQDIDTIQEEKEFAKITGKLTTSDDTTTLEIILAKKGKLLSKKFLVNGVARRLIDFASHLSSALFTPSDIELITDSPSHRRRFMDRILFQSSKDYRVALTLYEKALRARNKLLQDIKDERRVFRTDEFEYWNDLLITNGGIIHTKRADLIEYINSSSKPVFTFQVIYDHSTITSERIAQYLDIELRTGMTIIGPQRDELLFRNATNHPIKEYCSRGEQRLTVLQLKLLEIAYVKESIGENPILLLDDIFSELDQHNIEKITQLIPNQQTLITTTHKEFVPKSILTKAELIEI